MQNHSSNDYELLYLIYQKDDESLRLLIQKYEEIMYIFYHSQVSLMYHLHGYIDEYQIGRLVILKAIENYRLDKDVSFRHYFLFLLKNEMRNAIRGNQACFQLHLLSFDGLLQESPQDYLEDVFQDSKASRQADWIIRCDDVKEHLLELEKTLTPIEQKILRLRLYGYSYREITKILQVNMKKVDNTLCKVRNRKV